MSGQLRLPADITTWDCRRGVTVSLLSALFLRRDARAASRDADGGALGGRAGDGAVSKISNYIGATRALQSTPASGRPPTSTQAHMELATFHSCGL